MSITRVPTLAMCALVFSAATLAQEPPVEVVGGVSLPGIPKMVARDAAGAAAQSSEPDAASVLAPPAQALVTINPGTTELVRIGRGFLNEIVTPFADPVLLTVNPLEVRKLGSALYVATDSEKPVGVHVRSNDPQDHRDISLTLLPSRIPPRNVSLQFEGANNSPRAAAENSLAQHWEEASSYEEKIVELTTLIAKRQVPAGYSLREFHDALPCALPGMKFESGQQLIGSHFSVYVLRVTNGGKLAAELLNHAGCSMPGVIFVAPWPKAYLEPGASTELYVGVSNETADARAPELVRRSLLTH